MAGVFEQDLINKIKKQNQPQYGAYDIRGAGQYGLKMFDPNQTRTMLDTLAQRQISKDTGRAFRQGIVGGDFNPEGSSYEATQSARDASLKNQVDLDKYTYESQFPLMNSLLGIDQAKLNRDTLDFQKYQYEDSKPSAWSAIADIGLGILNAIPLEEGGVVPDTEQVYDNGGIIPLAMANAPPTNTADNTLIKAKTGEAVLKDNTTQALGGAPTINALNKIGDLKNMVAEQGIFSPEFKNQLGGQAKMGGGMPIRSSAPNSMMMGGMGTTGNSTAFNPNMNTMQNLGAMMGGRIRGMFGGAQGYQEGGVVGDDPQAIQSEIENYDAQEQAIVTKRNAIWSSNLPESVKQQNDVLLGEQQNKIHTVLEGLKTKLGNVQSRLNQQGVSQQVAPNVSVQPFQPTQGQADANQNGIPDNQEQTITIKTKPVPQPPTPEQMPEFMRAQRAVQ